jgi:hypothetical protein
MTPLLLSHKCKLSPEATLALQIQLHSLRRDLNGPNAISNLSICFELDSAPFTFETCIS